MLPHEMKLNEHGMWILMNVITNLFLVGCVLHYGRMMGKFELKTSWLTTFSGEAFVAFVLLQAEADQWIHTTSRWWRSGVASRRSRACAPEWRWWIDVWSDADDLLRLRVPRKRLVIAQMGVIHVTNLPALATEIADKRMNVRILHTEKCNWDLPEARKFATVVWSMLDSTHRAERILQVWIDLNLLGELWSFDFDEGSWHSTHVRTSVVESHTPGSNRIFVFVGIDAWENQHSES